MSSAVRIVAMSDTHQMHDRLAVPDGDILIHAGDVCNSGHPFELTRFADWFVALPHATKLYIPGNHDRIVAAASRDWLEAAFAHSVTLLIDRSVTVMGLHIYGTPWVPACGVWAYQYERGSVELAERADKIPDCDILVSHGPAWGICDVDQRIARAGPLGCASLRRRLERGGVRHHVHGHIHHADPWRNSGAWESYNVALRVAAFDVEVTA